MDCNSKLAQTKQQVVMHFVQCLSVFLTIQYGRILLTATESYPFFTILGAKRPVKRCLLAIRTCSKQTYRHLIMRWRYVDFKCLFAFIFGMYSVYLFRSKLQCHFPKKPRTIPFTKSTRGLLLITPSSIRANTIAPAIKTIRRIVNIGRQIRQ